MFFLESGGHPGDIRGFLHKSFIGKAVGKAFTTFVPGGSTAVSVVGAGRSLFSRARGRPTPPRTTTARVTLAGQQGQEFGKRVKFPSSGDGAPAFSATGFGAGGPCPAGQEWNVLRGRCETKTRAPCDFPMVRDIQGRCRTPTSGEFGGEQFGVGAAVMGRYGAALQPGSQIVDRAICLRGMQLADDGLCYNKSQISNKQRMWPAGRKPLLSGGDMRAIGTAARAGRRLDNTTKRLRKLGMMKALPAPRKAAPHAHAKQIAAVSVPQ